MFCDWEARPHWPCVTDSSDLSTYGLNGQRTGDEHSAYVPERRTAWFALSWLWPVGRDLSKRVLFPSTILCYHEQWLKHQGCSTSIYHHHHGLRSHQSVSQRNTSTSLSAIRSQATKLATATRTSEEHVHNILVGLLLKIYFSLEKANHLAITQHLLTLNFKYKSTFALPN